MNDFNPFVQDLVQELEWEHDLSERATNYSKSEIRRMQKQLSSLLMLPMEADGILGSKTRAAMQAFEKNVAPLKYLNRIYKQNTHWIKRNVLDRFKHKKYTFQFEHMQPLCQFARLVRKRSVHGGSKDIVLVMGHTDRSGSSSFNQKLSENRAREVGRHFATAIQCSSSRFRHSFTLKSVGFGEKFPISRKNLDPQSRRVEMVFIKVS